MFSGKSAELLTASVKMTQEGFTVGLFQSAENTREDGIVSRNGMSAPAANIYDLREINSDKYDAILIDELHFFDNPPEQALWLDRNRSLGKLLLVGVLDYDFSGKTMPVYDELLKKQPDMVHYLTAICGEKQDCTNPAEYTARLNNGEQLLEGPTCLVESDSVPYSPRCRDHFLPLKAVMDVTPVTL